MTIIGRVEALINGKPEVIERLRVSGVPSNRIFEDGTRNLFASSFCTNEVCGGERIKSEVRRVPGSKIINEDNIYCDRCPHRSV